MKQIVIIITSLVCFISIVSAQNPTLDWKKQLDKRESLLEKGLIEKSLRRTRALEKKQENTGFSKSTEPVTQAFHAHVLEVFGKSIEAQQLAKEAEKNWEQSRLQNDSSIRYFGELHLTKMWIALGFSQKATNHLKEASALASDDLSIQEQIELEELQYQVLQQQHDLNAIQIQADSLAVLLKAYTKRTYQVADTNGEIKTKKRKKSIYKQNRQLYAQWMLNSHRNQLKKGDYDLADSLYAMMGDTLPKYVKKKDIVYIQWMQGMAEIYHAKFEYYKAARWYKRAKQQYANQASNRVPDEFYLQAYEYEIIADLEGDNHQLAEKAVKRYDREVVNRFGKKSSHHIEAKRLKNEDDIYNGEYVKALRRVNRNINILKEYLPSSHPERITLIKQYQLLQLKNNNFPLAAQLQQQVLNITNTLHGTSSQVYQEELLELAKIEALHTFNFKLSDSLFTEHLTPNFIDVYHPHHPLYIQTLNAYAQLHIELDRYDSALHYFTLGRDIAADKYDTGSVFYGYQLGRMAEVKVEQGEFIEAEQLLNEAVSTIKSDHAKQSFAYYTALQELGELQRINGKFSDAEKTLNKALRVAKRIGLEIEGDGASSTLAYAQVLTEAGRYKEAEDILSNNINILTKKHGTDYYKLIEPYAALSAISLIKGDFVLAEKQVQEALRITETRLSDSSTKFVDNTILLGDVYYNMGSYEASEKAYKSALKNTQLSLGQNHIKNAAILTKIARLQIAQETGIDSTIATIDQALQIVQNAVGNQHPSYAQALELKADVLMNKAQYQEARLLLQQAKDIYVNSYGAGHLTTAKNTVRLANLSYLKGDYADAEINYNEALKAFQRIFNDQHPDYTTTMSKLGRTYYAAGDLGASNDVFDETTEIYLEYIERYFPSLTENEKAKYWQKIRPDFEIYNSLAINMANNNPKILRSMYNNKLATKAMLLSSSLKVKQQILASGDEALITLYSKWVAKREALTKSLSLSYEEQKAAGIQPEALEKDIAILEKQLGERSASFAANKSDILYSWKDVRKTLLDNEAAIEIIRFNYFTNQFTDSVLYAALIVTKETKKAPKLVLLPNGNDLETKYFKYYRNSIKYKGKDKYSYQQFWQPIDEALAEKSTIYLSSDGVYNQLNPETFLKPSGTYVLDDYLFYNVSNTKELVQHATAEPEPYLVNSAALFGNPAFSVSTLEDSKKVTASNRSIGNSISSVDPLPGAEKEVEIVDQLLNKGKWNTTSFFQESATEEQVKTLNNPRVLHIATHGFFVEGNAVQTSSLDDENTPVENPLLKSGLLFTGAEELLATDNIYQFNRKDGVLTAYEAMNLQLDNTELVVLSACETGLGEVKSGEGVYGLQRAFIVAGAQNVIMTLFKVDDKVTQQLMEEFYEEWLQTGDKRTAFLNAKRTILREHESPILWGSFMMIGLD